MNHKVNMNIEFIKKCDQHTFCKQQEIWIPKPNVNRTKSKCLLRQTFSSIPLLKQEITKPTDAYNNLSLFRAFNKLQELHPLRPSSLILSHQINHDHGFFLKEQLLTKRHTTPIIPKKELIIKQRPRQTTINTIVRHFKIDALFT